jgi:DNA polymerase-3 subunit delta'
MTQWQQLGAYVARDAIPCGLLLSGLQDTGKFSVAKQFAQLVLCQQPATFPCGHCRSCQLYLVGNHPDLLIVQPEGNHRAIKVEQIRHLVQVLGQTSALEHYQVTIISPAETMNQAAANALLKTLEEPRGAVLIILVSHHVTAVPATIRSRCQHIQLPVPTHEHAIKWLTQQLGSEQEAAILLAMTDNLPIKALQYAQHQKIEQRNILLSQLQQLQDGTLEPLKVAATYLSGNMQELLAFLTTIIIDMIRLKFRANDHNLNNRDKIAELSLMSHDRSAVQLFHYLDQVFEAMKLIISNVSLNSQLLLERLFIHWCYQNDIS